MNAKQLIAAAAVFGAAGFAFAGDVDPFPEQRQAVSTKTRAEVKAELAQARAQGWVTGGDESNYPEIPVKSTRSRAEVLAELEQARKQGLIGVGDESGYPEIPVKSTRSRAEVRAELEQARKQGLIGGVGDDPNYPETGREKAF